MLPPSIMPVVAVDGGFAGVDDAAHVRAETRVRRGIDAFHRRRCDPISTDHAIMARFRRT